MTEIKLFVPGRMGIVGEVSDLVTPFLNENKKLIPGCAIAISIDKGILATIKKNDKFLINFNKQNLKIDIDENRLLEVANDKTNFFSYACGVAVYMKRKYNIKGVEINIEKADLPIKKGLSSSAAICVLVVRAFNQIYNLNMTKSEQIEASYQGEHIALSKCGLLDQTTIYEKGLIKIIFEASGPKITEIKVKKSMYFIIVDLKSKKDTSKILSKLSACFPFPKNSKEKKVIKRMTIINKKIVDSTVKQIEKGNLKKVGENLKKYQKYKDKNKSICDEFIAPKLHTILNDKNIKKLSYGAKDVGAGGNSSAEIMAKDKQSMLKIKDYLQERYNLKSICITIDKDQV